MSRFRGWIQAAATLLTNIHLPNFFKGGIYQGKGKTICVPGADFDVFISENNKTYKYLINNASLESYVKIPKTSWQKTAVT